MTAIFSNSMEQLLWFQRKQIVIRMRMIQRLQSDLNSVSKLRQVITKPLQDYNDAVANAASDLEKAQDVLNQTIIVSDVNGTVVEVADSVGPISKES